MTEHDFKLDMDMDNCAMMPPQENWHDVAEAVAAAFKMAMHPQKFGHSNMGPVPRFVASVMTLMTNEMPSVSTVAQHLKRRARSKSF